MKKKSNTIAKVIAIIGIGILIFATVCIIVVKNNEKIIENLENEERGFDDMEEHEDIVMNTDLDVAFLKLENSNENIIYSPLSIKYALNMLKDGANGNTKKEIEKLISDMELPKYNNVEKELSIANAMFIKEEFQKKLNKDYEETLKNKYNAEIILDDFKKSNKINKWIEERTFGIIKNTVNDEIVKQENLRMILINALAIDMEWNQKFDNTKTNGQEFYLEDGTTINATTMYKKEKSDTMKYYDDNELTVVSMQLENSENTDLEFIALMPKEKKLSELNKEFTMEKLQSIEEKFVKASDTKPYINLWMPRFSFDYSLKLKENLKKLGLIDVFSSNNADFSNISEENLYVDEILHKANIDFTEKGVKAAATTVVLMLQGMAPATQKPIDIKINKPFMFFIKDQNTGTIWFTGNVYRPNEWEKDELTYEYR